MKRLGEWTLVMLIVLAVQLTVQYVSDVYQQRAVRTLTCAMRWAHVKPTPDDSLLVAGRCGPTGRAK